MAKKSVLGPSFIHTTKTLDLQLLLYIFSVPLDLIP